MSNGKVKYIIRLTDGNGKRYQETTPPLHYRQAVVRANNLALNLPRPVRITVHNSDFKRVHAYTERAIVTDCIHQ